MVTRLMDLNADHLAIGTDLDPADTSNRNRIRRPELLTGVDLDGYDRVRFIIGVIHDGTIG